MTATATKTATATSSVTATVSVTSSITQSGAPAAGLYYIAAFAGTGGVTGVSPSGTLATAAKLNGPQCAILDGVGGLIVTDVINNLVRNINASGHLNTRECV